MLDRRGCGGGGCPASIRLVPSTMAIYTRQPPHTHSRTPRQAVMQLGLIVGEACSCRSHGMVGRRLFLPGGWVIEGRGAASAVCLVDGGVGCIPASEELIIGDVCVCQVIRLKVMSASIGGGNDLERVGLHVGEKHRRRLGEAVGLTLMRRCQRCQRLLAAACL